ncbi:MAG TPA: hypothetical protein VMG11_12490 [Steroidobacteraceae bacterium]|nr:hypothetical protein [Steroidobacteraceae bacterium]
MAKRTPVGVLAVAALTLNGCWTAPVANVQPPGEPRLIQEGIQVESVKDAAVVESVDTAMRTIVLLTSGEPAPSTYKVGPKVSDLERIKAGAHVKATVTERLAVYVLREGQLPGANGASERIASSAKVLTVDPSYRLLQVQYPSGLDETFKVAPDVKLKEMAAGDDVVIHSEEALRIKIR